MALRRLVSVTATPKYQLEERFISQAARGKAFGPALPQRARTQGLAAAAKLKMKPSALHMHLRERTKGRREPPRPGSRACRRRLG